MSILLIVYISIYYFIKGVVLCLASYNVFVYGIFTNGSTSGGTATQRRARLNADIAKCNQTWQTGGTSCINFVSGGTYSTQKIINASVLTTNQAMKNGGPVDTLISQVKGLTNNAIGIYVVYLSGDYFAGGSGRTFGTGSGRFADFRNANDYKIFGYVALTNQAAGSYALAHENGHVLFTSYDSAQNAFLTIDPSGPYINPQTNARDIAHNNNVNNIMYPTVPRNNPVITSLQCQKARQSKVVLVQN
ncbi:hypothetical protein [Bacillus cereus group sp. RP43]|uniref:hypothetical protein n=1 Tax=Bacillus cereus group sp. RP43 TaxID=3040260 RepID=UPI003393B4FF